MTRIRRIASVLLLSGIILSVSDIARAADRVLVFAAASTRDLLRDAAENFRRTENGSGADIVFSFASSGTLASQIIAGAPADLFLSANVKWMTSVQNAGMVGPDSRKNLLSNRLVLIAPRSSTARFSFKQPSQLPALLGDGRLAIGAPKSVPAGIYAKEALTALGLWPKLVRKLAPASDARLALALVERGATKVGIVYKSDAVASKRVKILDILPATSHQAIQYPLALMKRAEANRTAKSFYSYLNAATLAQVASKHGFNIP